MLGICLMIWVGPSRLTIKDNGAIVNRRINIYQDVYPGISFHTGADAE